MTSKTEEVATEPMHRYSAKAVKCVVDALARAEDRLDEAILRGEFPRGTFLKEVVHKFTSKPFMDADQLTEFRTVEQLYAPEEVLVALWVILENDCGEKGLLPALTVERERGELVVILR